MDNAIKAAKLLVKLFSPTDLYKKKDLKKLVLKHNEYLKLKLHYSELKKKLNDYIKDSIQFITTSGASMNLN